MEQKSSLPYRKPAKLLENKNLSIHSEKLNKLNPPFKGIIKDFIRDEIAKKGWIQLKASELSSSMKKFISPNDILIFSKVDCNTLAPGDVILFSNGEELIAHRIISVYGNFVITKGDAVDYHDEPISKAECLGKLIKIKHDSKEIDCASFKRIEESLDFLFLNATLPKAICDAEATKLFIEKIRNNETLLSVLYVEGLAQLFFFCNKELFASEELKPIYQKLSSTYYDTLARNTVILNKIKQILKELSPTKFIILKGAFLSDHLYDTPALRPFSDIDVLIQPENFDTVSLKLKSMGFVSEQEELNPKNIAKDLWLNSTCFYNTKELPMRLHLHWHWCNSNRPIYSAASRNMEKVWLRANPLDHSNEQQLCNEHLLINLCEHSIKHSFDRLILLRDIIEVLVKKQKEIRWDMLIEDALSFGMERHVYYALLYVSRIVPFFVPSAVLATLKPVNKSFLSKKFFSLAEKGIRDPELVNLFYFEMLIGWKAKLTFLWNTLFGDVTIKNDNMNAKRKIHLFPLTILRKVWKIFTRFFLIIRKAYAYRAWLFTLFLLLILTFTNNFFGEEDKWWAEDKGLHFIASFAIDSGGYWIGRECFALTKKEALISAGAGTLGLGVAKELTDDEFSYKDLVWNCVGITTSTLLWWLIDQRIEDKHRIRIIGILLPNKASVSMVAEF